MELHISTLSSDAGSARPLSCHPSSPWQTTVAPTQLKLFLSFFSHSLSLSRASKVLNFHSPLIVDQDHHHPEHQKLTLLLSESRSLAPAARSRYKGLPSTLYYNVFSVFCICVCI